jgi:hypothetical protein
MARPVIFPVARRATRLPIVPRLTALISLEMRKSLYKLDLILIRDPSFLFVFLTLIKDSREVFRC